MVQSNKLPLYLSGWSADYPDPHDWLSLQWETGALDNNVHYSNPHFDELAQTADVTWNYTARMRLYNQAQQTLVDDAAWIPLYIPHRVVYMRSTVQNLSVTGYGIIPRSGSWAQVQVKSSSSAPQHHLKAARGT
jgi:peptide/nickel transport system substrate-binding protein/oligopeptide transport system substrate-binding protein